ncbi:MAG: TIGR02281 family clan AA aspartic protease [Proteobacteria bacterium]|nr:TIGR02281 family clan AA aspartic protease [Pseudomonadota bacterium]
MFHVLSGLLRNTVVTCCLCCCLPPAALAVDVEVRGLFNGAALLLIDGEQVLLRAGESGFGDITLLEADTTRAVVLIEGQQRTLHLSDHISGRFSPVEKAEVRIAMGDNRQYITHGSINSRSVRFLVDTGANVIAMNANTARSLGISLEDGQKTRARTASDLAEATLVTLREVQVGDIRQRNIQAIVMAGEHPTDILLGMSFLQHVEISENSGLMVLTARY